MVKENIFSIGTYPEVSLAQARRCRDEARLKSKMALIQMNLKSEKTPSR